MTLTFGTKCSPTTISGELTIQCITVFLSGRTCCSVAGISQGRAEEFDDDNADNESQQLQSNYDEEEVCITYSD